jgi:hypothetical protein
MKTTLKFVIRPLLAFFVIVTCTWPFGYVTPSFADCSMLRGTDSAAEFGLSGYVGNDNPGNDHGSYAPGANWHDLWFYDCGYQYNNWSKDKYIRWGSAEVEKLYREYLYRTIVHEVRVSPLGDYDNTGLALTSLPISGGRSWYLVGRAMGWLP